MRYEICRNSKRRGGDGDERRSVFIAGSGYRGVGRWCKAQSKDPSVICQSRG